MARLLLKQPYNGQQAGEEITLPGGIASAIVLRGIATLLSDPRPVRPEKKEEAPVILIDCPGRVSELETALDRANELLETTQAAASGLRWALEQLTTATQEKEAAQSEQIATLEAENERLQEWVTALLETLNKPVETPPADTAETAETPAQAPAPPSTNAPAADSTPAPATSDPAKPKGRGRGRNAAPESE